MLILVRGRMPWNHECYSLPFEYGHKKLIFVATVNR